MFKLKKYVKRSVYLVLYFTGIVHLSILINKKFQTKHPAIILFYHRFTDHSSNELPPKLNVKTFENQIKHLKKWYQLISLDELVDQLKTGKDFSHPYAVITIDDGFKDNYDFAFPLLKRYDMRASIYLTTGFIGTDSVPWIEEIACALNTTPKRNFKFEKLFHNKTFNISNHLKKFDLWTEIYEKMLYLQHDTKNDLVTEILQKLNGGNKHKTRVMLDWDEVGEMSRNQISFGAHSVSHPTLSRMHPDEAMFEIRESRRVIEEKLGVSVRHFAIPNGKDEDFTEELREFCKSEGFDSVVTTNYGVVTKESDPYALPRVSPSEPIYVFAAELARLFIFGR
jgi:peptidoglycan/xylan/chitin deacetylase (PgdA/CDA1 family)